MKKHFKIEIAAVLAALLLCGCAKQLKQLLLKMQVQTLNSLKPSTPIKKMIKWADDVTVNEVRKNEFFPVFSPVRQTLYRKPAKL